MGFNLIFFARKFCIDRNIWLLAVYIHLFSVLVFFIEYIYFKESIGFWFCGSDLSCFRLNWLNPDFSLRSFHFFNLLTIDMGVLDLCN